MVMRFVRRVLNETWVFQVQQCRREKGSKLLRQELVTNPGFHQQQSAYRYTNDPGLNLKTVRRFVQRLGEPTYHVTEYEAGRLKRVVESHEA